MFLMIAAFSLLFFLMPESAFAWGPLTHIRFGLEALHHLPLFAAAIQDLLRLYPLDFLYGNMSADLVIGKDFVEESNRHCHEWDVGFDVLEAAGSPKETAFAYGYLCHLAADTISHNFYVPELSVTHFRAKRLQHTYWEMRFDQAVANDLWGEAFDVAKRCRYHDKLLASVLEETLFSFRTNGRIFHGILWAQRLKRWRRTMAWIDRRSRWTVPRRDVDRFFSWAMDAVLGFLADPERAYCRRLDPTGHPVLHSAKKIRIILQELDRENRLTPSILEKVDKGLKEGFPPPGLYTQSNAEKERARV